MYTHIQMDTFLNLTNPLPVIYLGLKFVVALLLADETEKKRVAIYRPYLYYPPPPANGNFTYVSCPGGHFQI